MWMCKKMELSLGRVRPGIYFTRSWKCKNWGKTDFDVCVHVCVCECGFKQ